MEALQDWWGNTQDVVTKIIAAAEATDPTRADVRDKDWTLYLDVPQLEVFTYLAARQQEEFTVAFTKAVESHKKYWSSKKAKRHMGYRGFVSFELSALGVLAIERGLKVEVESPYVPLRLLSEVIGPVG
jgi:hypothetical protein